MTLPHKIVINKDLTTKVVDGSYEERIDTAHACLNIIIKKLDNMEQMVLNETMDLLEELEELLYG